MIDLIRIVHCTLDHSKKNRIMKYVLALLVLLSFTISLDAQELNPNYDSALAQELEADDYGMKPYILVILKTGTNTSDDADLRSKSFSGHMENMNKLVADGKLIVAGPIEENDKQYRGIFILDVKTKEEAEELLQTDPAIKANYLAADLYSWYGSAALKVYLDASEKVNKFSF